MGFAAAMKPLSMPLPPDDAPLRVVLDTNVVLALWHYRHPRLLELRAWLDARGAVLLTRAGLLDELAHVLRLPAFGLAPVQREAVLADYRARCVAAPEAAGPDAVDALPRCRDPDDQPFLTLAWEAEAHLLLTRDKRVLAMAGRSPWSGRTQIVTPERLLGHLAARPEEEGRVVVALDARRLPMP